MHTHLTSPTTSSLQALLFIHAVPEIKNANLAKSATCLTDIMKSEGECLTPLSAYSMLTAETCMLTCRPIIACRSQRCSLLTQEVKPIDAVEVKIDTYMEVKSMDNHCLALAGHSSSLQLAY